MNREKIEESLDVIEGIFPDMKKAMVEGHFPIYTAKLNPHKEALRCIKLYAILKDIDKLTGRKLEVLVYYLLYGFSKETKKDVIEGLKITESNLNNINCELRRLKVINSVGYNQASNEVNKDLIKFKEFIVDKKGNYILIKIV